MKTFLLIIMSPLAIIALFILFNINYSHSGKLVDLKIKTQKDN